MLDVTASRRQRARERMATAVREYAAMGWVCSPGAYPLTDGSRACSCDRVGCPAPGAHPHSPVWQLQATTDPRKLAGWWDDQPEANIILPTGGVFDVIDVPAAAGIAAFARITRITRDGLLIGPVAAVGEERYLFFVTTRGAPDDEDEWWSCHLDCFPETVAENPGVRWHCRDSYVVAPPSVLPYGREVTWIRRPDGSPLPDPLYLLEVLVEACEGERG